MSKGLEALKNIHSHWNCCNPNSNGCDDKDFDTIEKALKALEIIKKKQVNCYDIINSVDYNHYLVLMKEYDKSWLLTQEEYDLLKEVLV